MAGTKQQAAQNNGTMDASAVRIRDNQRRSRARRKEYLEDMQKKLQEYERQGVQATLDMQQAARDVAIENDRLRMLLHQRGVSPDEIVAYLQSFSSTSSTSCSTTNSSSSSSSSCSSASAAASAWIKTTLDQPQSPQRPGHRHPKMALPPLAAAVTTPPAEPHHASTPVPLEPAPVPYGPPTIHTPPEHGPAQHSVPPYANVVLPPIHTLAPSEGAGLDKLAVLAHASARQGDCCSGQTQCVRPTEVSQAPSPAATVTSSSQLQAASPDGHGASNYSPLEMSCSQAAQIIADMHGHGDFRLTKMALGCGASEECSVKNSVVFQMLESQETM